jgi:glycerophosphoryl diester phosphodiesterase
VRAGGIRAQYVALIEGSGSAPDSGIPYASMLTDAGLDALAADRFDGISVDKATLLDAAGPALVQRAHDRGLRVFTWTLRPENAFLAARLRRGTDAAAHGDYLGEWAAIHDTGVDAVFVDHPALWLAAFG